MVIAEGMGIFDDSCPGISFTAGFVCSLIIAPISRENLDLGITRSTPLFLEFVGKLPFHVWQISYAEDFFVFRRVSKFGEDFFSIDFS